MIGPLPHLEVIQLRSDAVRGSEWNLVEGEFLHLKFLIVSNRSDLKLEYGRVSFPSLGKPCSCSIGRNPFRYQRNNNTRGH